MDGGEDVVQDGGALGEVLNLRVFEKHGAELGQFEQNVESVEFALATQQFLPEFGLPVLQRLMFLPCSEVYGEDGFMNSQLVRRAVVMAEAELLDLPFDEADAMFSVRRADASSSNGSSSVGVLPGAWTVNKPDITVCEIDRKSVV